MFAPNLEEFLARLAVPSGDCQSSLGPVLSSTLRRLSSATRWESLPPLSQISRQPSLWLSNRAQPAIFFPLANKSFKCNAYKKQGRGLEPLGPYITCLSASSVTRRNAHNSNPFMQLLHNLRTPPGGGSHLKKNRRGEPPPSAPRASRHNPPRAKYASQPSTRSLPSTFNFRLSTLQVQSPHLNQGDR
jgi:hypothetical protein